MNLPDDCRLTYIITHETWYWPITPRRQRRGIGIHATSSGGGVAWEFYVEERDLGHRIPALELRMFDDAWMAFDQIPEFFAGLREVAEGGRLSDVREFLDRLGAVDETARTSPVDR
jgi:hypothetical protein